MVDKVHVDIESYSRCDLPNRGLMNYANDESTGIWCLQFAVNDQDPELWLPGMTRPQALIPEAGVQYHAWNSMFEMVMLSTTLGWDIPIALWHDTMAKSRATGLPGTLGECGDLLGGGVSFAKSKRGTQLIKLLSCPYRTMGKNAPWQYAWEIYETDPANGILQIKKEEFALVCDLAMEFQDYCAQDVVAERWIDQQLPDLTATERRVWEIDQQINMRGVRLDVPNIENAIEIYSGVNALEVERLKELTGLSNPGSRAQFFDWINKQLDTL